MIGQARGIKRNGCHGHTGRRLGIDFAAVQYTILVGVARDDDNRSRRSADVLGHCRRIAGGAVAVLVGLGGADRDGIAVARIGERDRDVAVGIRCRYPMCRTRHRTVGSDTQGGGHAIVVHRHGRAAVGGKCGGVQCDVGDGHAGRRFGIHFTAAQHAVAVRIARDRHHGRRHADVLDRAGGIAGAGIAVLVGLRGVDRDGIAVAGIGKGQRQGAVAVHARDAIGAARHRAVGRNRERGRHTMVVHRHAGATVGGQIGRIERHGGLRHTRRRFGIDFAAREHAIMVGIAGDGDDRGGGRADVFGRRGGVAIDHIAVQIGLGCRNRDGVAVAGIGKGQRHIAVAVAAGNAVGGAAHGAVRSHGQGGHDAVVDHDDAGTAAVSQVGRIERHVGLGHAGGRLGIDVAAAQHAVLVGVGGDGHHRHAWAADGFEHARAVAARCIAVLVGLGGRDGRRMAIAGVGEIDGDGAVAIGARDAVGSPAHRAVGRNGQGRAYTIVEHGDGGAAVGCQTGCIERDGGHGHAGLRFGIDFAGRQHAVMIRVAGDDDRRRCRAADVLGRAGRGRGRYVVVLVGLGGRDGDAIAVAGIEEINRDRAVAVGRGNTVGRARHRAVMRHGQGRGDAIVEHGDGGAAVGRQVGRIDGHVGHGHARRGLAVDFAAAQHAVVVGIGADGDRGRGGTGRGGRRRRQRIRLARCGRDRVARSAGAADRDMDAVGGRTFQHIAGNADGERTIRLHRAGIGMAVQRQRDGVARHGDIAARDRAGDLHRVAARAFAARDRREGVERDRQRFGRRGGRRRCGRRRRRAGHTVVRVGTGVGHVACSVRCGNRHVHAVDRAGGQHVAGHAYAIGAARLHRAGVSVAIDRQRDGIA